MVENAKANQRMLLPVYRSNGNLLWPKQMTYKEVKAFVAERDAKKAWENNEVDSGSSPE